MLSYESFLSENWDRRRQKSSLESEGNTKGYEQPQLSYTLVGWFQALSQGDSVMELSGTHCRVRASEQRKVSLKYHSNSQHQYPSIQAENHCECGHALLCLRCDSGEVYAAFRDSHGSDLWLCFPKF